MRTFDADIVSALSNEEVRDFWLVECQFDTTYYFTDCDVDLVYGGNTYQSDQGCRVANIQHGAGFNIDKVTVEFGNVELWMSSILLNEDVANDTVIIRHIMFSASVPVVAGGESGTGGDVILQDGDVVLEDGDVVLQGSEFYSVIGTPPVFFNGFVSAWKLNEEKVNISLSTEFMLWRKKTLRLPSSSCAWSFKSTECGYSGSEAWCDQSRERCVSLSNYDSFGGRKFILSIEDKKVYWGDKGYTGPA